MNTELPVWLDCLVSKFKDPPVFTLLSGSESWEHAAMAGFHLAAGDPRSWPHAAHSAVFPCAQESACVHVCERAYVCARVYACVVHVCLVFTSLAPERFLKMNLTKHC